MQHQANSKQKEKEKHIWKTEPKLKQSLEKQVLAVGFWDVNSVGSSAYLLLVSTQHSGCAGTRARKGRQGSVPVGKEGKRSRAVSCHTAERQRHRGGQRLHAQGRGLQMEAAKWCWGHGEGCSGSSKQQAQAPQGMQRIRS